MRLIECLPRWVKDSHDRHGMGLSLLCPNCQAIRIAVWFKQPLDGGPPLADPGKHLWDRSGEDFEHLTLSPSIDASGDKPPCTTPGLDVFDAGHWHGNIEAGTLTNVQPHGS